MKTILLSLLLASVATTACTKEDPQAALKPLIDKHRPMVEAKLAAVAKLAADAKSVPPVAAPEPLKAPIPADATLGSEVLYGSLELVLDPHARPSLVLLVKPSLEDLRTIIDPATKSLDDSELTLGYKFTGFEKAQYALFVRTREYSPSKVAHSAAYTPGTAAGDALLYDLGKQERIGAFPWSFTAKGEVAVREGAGDSVMQSEVDKHDRDSFTRQLGEALKAYAAPH
jgi:hypothetical protein